MAKRGSPRRSQFFLKRKGVFKEQTGKCNLLKIRSNRRFQVVNASGRIMSLKSSESWGDKNRQLWAKLWNRSSVGLDSLSVPSPFCPPTRPVSEMPRFLTARVSVLPCSMVSSGFPRRETVPSGDTTAFGVLPVKLSDWPITNHLHEELRIHEPHEVRIFPSAARSAARHLGKGSRNYLAKCSRKAKAKGRVRKKTQQGSRGLGGWPTLVG